MTEEQLLGQVRAALVAYRNYFAEVLASNVIERRETGKPVEKVRDNATTSHTQVESAMRVLRMEN